MIQSPSEEKINGEALEAFFEHLDTEKTKYSIWEKVIEHGIDRLKEAAEKNEGVLSEQNIIAAQSSVRSYFDEGAEKYFSRQIFDAKSSAKRARQTVSYPPNNTPSR